MTSPRTLNARTTAALPVGTSMNEVEASINTSMVKIGELLANIGRARLDREARMPLSIGMAATDQITQAATALSAAYRLSVAAHGCLATDKSMLGLQVVDWGDYSNTYNAFDDRRLAQDAGAPASGPAEVLRAVA